MRNASVKGGMLEREAIGSKPRCLIDSYDPHTSPNRNPNTARTVFISYGSEFN